MGSDAWGPIIGAVGLLVALAGHLLTRRGKKRDEDAQTAEQAWSRLLGEITYWKQAAESARQEKDAEVERLEGRWSRQMDRCRRSLDAATAKIVELAKLVSSAQRESAEAVLSELEEHREHDHPPSGEVGG